MKNNKGFAISIILYSIAIVICLILVLIVSIISNSIKVEDRITEAAKKQITNISTPTTETCFTFSAGTITAYNISCTKDVVIPSTIGGVAVTAIGASAFASKTLTSVVIPSGVTTIGANAFQTNSLTRIIIPTSVTTIGNYAFANNLIKNVAIPRNITTISEGLFKDNKIVTVYICKNVTTIGLQAFMNNLLTTVTFETGTALNTNGVANSAFYKATGSNIALTTITYSGSNLEDWIYAINGVTGTQFTRGTVTNGLGNVTISN